MFCRKRVHELTHDKRFRRKLSFKGQDKNYMYIYFYN